MKQLLLIMILSMFVGSGQTMAAPTVLDFEALAHTGDKVIYHSISEDGFTISAAPNEQWDIIAISGSGGLPGHGGYYKGSATAWIYAQRATAYLAKDDSGPFDLNFIDLARFSSVWTGPVIVNIKGYNNVGNQVASQSFTLPNTYALNDSFLGIYQASWTQNPDYFQFDNIVINAIPEPATLSLLALGAILAGRKRRTV
jgi:hypothetical protein